MRSRFRTKHSLERFSAVALSLWLAGSCLGHRPDSDSPNLSRSRKALSDQITHSQSKKPINIDTGQSVLTPRQIADKALRSIVLITTTDEKGTLVGQGSGFVFRPGLVVTNLHVFTRATRAVIKTLANGKSYKAIEVVGLNAKHDLCVIRFDDRSIPPLPLATAERTRPGDEVYVVSNPEGLEGSVTRGIVSSIRIDAGLLQIDAAISAGSSGGAVVNQKAEVVGIVKSSRIGGQNLNFAVPVEYLRSLSLDFTLPVVVAGACAYRDRDKDKLQGLVRSVLEKKETREIDTTSRRIERVVLPQSFRVYDIDGNLVEDHFYDVKGEMFLKRVKTYDENRLQTQLIETAGDGRVLRRVTFTFDEGIDQRVNNKKFSAVVTFPESASLGAQTYDSEGNMTEWLRGKERTVYRYDPDGRIKEKFVYSGNRLLTRYRYSYEDDDNGNWIVMREFVFEPAYPETGWSKSDITLREITYF